MKKIIIPSLLTLFLAGCLTLTPDRCGNEGVWFHGECVDFDRGDKDRPDRSEPNEPGTPSDDDEGEDEGKDEGKDEGEKSNRSGGGDGSNPGGGGNDVGYNNPSNVPT